MYVRMHVCMHVCTYVYTLYVKNLECLKSFKIIKIYFMLLYFMRNFKCSVEMMSNVLFGDFTG